jgi:hypothetical protein
MKVYKDKLNKILDKLITELNFEFNRLLFAHILYERGQWTIDEICDDVTISPKIGQGLHIEPINMVHVKEYRKYYPFFLYEVFQGKIVQLWNNCLCDIFSLFLDLHLSNKRKFSEFKKQQIKLDFRSTEEIITQVRGNFIEDFNFKNYSDRQKLINDTLNPDKKEMDHLYNIHKHVLIRNAIQHNEGFITPYLLKMLGCTEIEILDIEGKLTKRNLFI